MKIVKIFIFLFYSSSVFCQINNELDQKYTPPQKSFFGKKAKQLTKNNYDHPLMSKNTVFLQVLSLFRNELVFDYQYLISPKFSTSIGIGGIYNNDIFERYLSFSSFFEEIKISNESGYSLNKFYNYAAFKSGFVFSLSLKYYNEETFGYSTFLALRCNFVNRKYSLPDKIYKYNLSNYPGGSLLNTNLNYFAIERGVIKSFYWGKKFFYQELLFGFGVKISKWDQFVDVLDRNNYVVGLKKNEGIKVVGFSPFAYLQYRLGLGW